MQITAAKITVSIYVKCGGVINLIFRKYTLSQKIYAPRRKRATIKKLSRNAVW